MVSPQNKRTADQSKRIKTRKPRRRFQATSNGGLLASLQPFPAKVAQDKSVGGKSWSDAGGESTPSPRAKAREVTRDSTSSKTPPPSSVIVSNRIPPSLPSFTPGNVIDEDESPAVCSDVSSLSSHPGSRNNVAYSLSQELATPAFHSDMDHVSVQDEEESLKPKPLFQDDRLCPYRADDEQLSEKEDEEFTDDDSSSSSDIMVKPIVSTDTYDLDEEYEPDEETSSDTDIELEVDDESSSTSGGLSSDDWVGDDDSTETEKDSGDSDGTPELEGTKKDSHRSNKAAHNGSMSQKEYGGTKVNNHNIPSTKEKRRTSVLSQSSNTAENEGPIASYSYCDSSLLVLETSHENMPTAHELRHTATWSGSSFDEGTEEDEGDVAIASVVEALADTHIEIRSSPFQEIQNMEDSGPGIGNATFEDSALAVHRASNTLHYSSTDENSYVRRHIDGNKSNGNYTVPNNAMKISEKGRALKREGSVPRGKWCLGTKIGKGSFGVVRVGMNQKTGMLMAVKTVQLENAVMKDIRREVNLLRSLKHVNIVRYLGAGLHQTQLHIFQEWVPGGSVTSLLHKFGPFPISVLRSYLLQVVRGLAYLHDRSVIHRDIKGGNILVSDAGIVKLADFGSSKKVARDQRNMESLTMRGTPYFMAPEVFEEKYDSKADIWSVGCVAYQMATGTPPWKTLGVTNPMCLFAHLRSSDGPPAFELPVSAEKTKETTLFEILLQKCFFRDPSLRPSANELLTASIFADLPSSEEETVSRGLFSPGADSLSTWGTKSSPPIPVSDTKPHSMLAKETGEQCSNAKTKLFSPHDPFTVRCSKKALETVSPLPLEPSTPLINPEDWPTWAKQKHRAALEAETEPLTQQDLTKDLSHKAGTKTLHSLAVSEDTCDVLSNPFGIRCSRGSLSPLGGIEFVD